MGRMYNPPHPGALLKENLEELHLSNRKFAERIGVSHAAVSRFVNEKSAITPELALRISKVLPGPDAEMWLAMQADYNTWQTEQKLKLIPLVSSTALSKQHRKINSS